jgi:acyl carrier protein
VSLDSQIQDFIVREMCVGKGIDSISEDDDLLAGDVIDSLGISELITFLESEYRITVDDSDLDPENFRTLRKIVALVDSKRPDS